MTSAVGPAATCFKSTKSLHVLRGLLRHGRKLPSFSSAEAIIMKGQQAGEESESNIPPKAYIMNQYRKSQYLDPESSEALQNRRLAYDYWQLVTNIKERGRLHELDGGAEIKFSPKEFTRRAAARVGFQMPDEI